MAGFPTHAPTQRAPDVARFLAHGLVQRAPDVARFLAYAPARPLMWLDFWHMLLLGGPLMRLYF